MVFTGVASIHHFGYFKQKEVLRSIRQFTSLLGELQKTDSRVSF